MVADDTYPQWTINYRATVQGEKGLDKRMETTALMLKIVGAIIQITSIAYTITAIAKKKRKHIWIGIALFVVAFLLLNQATHMEDRLRGGY